MSSGALNCHMRLEDWGENNRGSYYNEFFDDGNTDIIVELTKHSNLKFASI